MVLLTDEILARMGGYVLGNLLTSFIAGLGTWVWAEIFGIPYALLLGLLVALLDLIPVVGSTIGEVIVALIALTVSPRSRSPRSRSTSCIDCLRTICSLLASWPEPSMSRAC